MKKLSSRALDILLRIDEVTNDGSIWIPCLDTRKNWDWCRARRRELMIGGPGDAAILRSLEQRGLIYHPESNLGEKYAYQVTEDGRQAAERKLEELFPGGERP